ncbi:MAG: hypothetical protein MZU97_25640 [Bacillus subtilis]|nr:hypothetical protein [Bacillus subtilis]
MLQALYIYSQLVDTDITKGLNIAGTGTIEYSGAVGYIGGVKQKIITAYYKGADLFFIPYLSTTYALRQLSRSGSGVRRTRHRSRRLADSGRFVPRRHRLFGRAR